MAARRTCAGLAVALWGLGLASSCQFDRPNDVKPVNAATVGFSVEPVAATWVRVGESVDVVVRVVRESGYEAPIVVGLANPPNGVTAAPFTIPPGAVEGLLRVSVAAGAGVPGSALDAMVLADGGQGERQVTGARGARAIVAASVPGQLGVRTDVRHHRLCSAA